MRNSYKLCRKFQLQVMFGITRRMLECNYKIILYLKGFKRVIWFQLANHRPCDDNLPKTE